MNNFNDLKNFLTDYLICIMEFADLENKKSVYIKNHDLDALSQIINLEQAHALKLRGMEKKREQIQLNLGYENLTFKELIEIVPDIEQKKELNNIFNRLSNAIFMFKSTCDANKKNVKLNVHVINREINNIRTKK